MNWYALAGVSYFIVSFANAPFATIDTAIIIRSSRQVLFFKNGVLTNSTKFTRKHRKRDFRTYVSHNIFLKNPSDGCFTITTLLFTVPPRPFAFQKQCHTYFLAEYFFGLICRLGTRVSSIFQALSQKPIFNPVEHLRWSFFCENS